MKTFFKDLDSKIENAVKEDVKKILKEVGDERIYAAALVTDSDCITLFLALNTYEYMKKRDREYLDIIDLSEEMKKNLEDGSASLTKWLPDEWGYSDGNKSQLNEISKLLFKHDEETEYDEEEYEESQQLFLETVTSAFKRLIEENVFGEYSKEITYFISMSDDERAEEIENQSAGELNSRELYEAFLNRNIL